MYKNFSTTLYKGLRKNIKKEKLKNKWNGSTERETEKVKQN